MRDQDQRQTETLAQALEELEDLRLHHHVERGRRLVGDHERWVACERERRHRPLALAARQLMRIAPCRGRGQADRRHELLDPLSDLGLARVAIVKVDRLGDLVVDALDRVEGVHRALEDQRDVTPAHYLHAPLRPPPDVDLLRHVLGAQGDRPGLRQRRRQEPHYRERRGRLPAPRFAGKPKRLSRSQLEADPVDDG